MTPAPVVRFPLLVGADSAPIASALDASDFVTRRDLRCDVATVRSRAEIELASRGTPLLESRREVLVAVSDRYLMLVACLALWRLGVTVVLGPNLQPGAIVRVAETSRAALCVTDDATLAVAVSVPSVTLASSELRRARSKPESPFDVGAEIPVVGMYTSGTTGEHQRCTKSARQLFGEARVLIGQLGFGGRHVVAATVPGHHLYGLLFSVLVPFFAGAAFVRPCLYHPDSVAKAIRDFGVTDLILVPTHLRAFLAGSLRPMPPLRRVFSSGAVLDRAEARRFTEVTGAEVIDVLGSTESGGIGFRRAATQEHYVPFAGIDVRVDGDGRMQLRSPFLPVADEWVSMSDDVRLLPGGFEHLGRSDGVVKLGGKRLALQELEARVCALPDVLDAKAVLCASSSLRGGELWLVVATNTDRWDADSLRRTLARDFDAVLLPRRYRFVPALPRNAFGKVQRDALLRLFELDANGRDVELPEADDM